MITRVYLDTSAYVKYFKDEFGSDSVRRIILIAHKNRSLRIFMSLWTINESVTAIDKYHRKNWVSSLERDQIIATILADNLNYLQNYPNFVLVPVTSNIVKESISLIPSLHLSADDSLHVYTAIKRRCKYFIFEDSHLKDQVPKNIQGLTMLYIKNLNDMKSFFNDVKKYESSTIKEWKIKSIQGEVCAILGCSNIPKNRCPKCFLHYCYDHIKSHVHRISDEEVARRKKETDSLK